MTKSTLSHLSGIMLLFALLACGGEGEPSSGPESSAQAGRLVIVGGGLQAENTEVYQAVLDGRGGEGPLAHHHAGGRSDQLRRAGGWKCWGGKDAVPNL